jgi:hypothetical protein
MEHIEQLAITATRVSDDDRLGFLPRHFGAQMMIVERALYAELRHLCAEYRGGWWNLGPEQRRVLSGTGWRRDIPS